MWKTIVYIILVQYVFSWYNNTTLVTTPLGAGLYSIAFSPDTKRFVTGSFSTLINLYDRKNLSIIATHYFAAGSYRVTYSKNGLYIAAAGLKQNVDILDYDLNFVTTLNTGMAFIYCADFTFDNQFIMVAGAAAVIQFWSVSNWGLSHTVTTNSTSFYCCSIAPDGKFVVAGHFSLIAYDSFYTITYYWGNGVFYRI